MHNIYRISIIFYRNFLNFRKVLFWVEMFLLFALGSDIKERESAPKASIEEAWRSDPCYIYFEMGVKGYTEKWRIVILNFLVICMVLYTSIYYMLIDIT